MTGNRPPDRQRRSTLRYSLHSGKNSKLAYYVKATLREAVPDGCFRQRLERELKACRGLYDERYVADRVDYYCKLDGPRPLGTGAPRIGDFHKRGHASMYYYDSHEIIRWFDPDLRWQYLFGDQRDIPPSPTVVKSRSTLTDNSNAILLNLNKNRHFIFVNDRRAFERKRDEAVFRGQVGSRENRQRFVRQFAGSTRVDAANTLAKGGLFSTNVDGQAIAPRLSIGEQLRYRYIMTLEGNDVASNLKWVMSSHSLAVTPPMTCETWFMEGRLVGGEHYVEIKEDFSDLEAQMDHYSSHPAEAKEIIANANHYVSQFRDRRRERYIALRVMQRYFELTGTQQTAETWNR